MRSRQSESTFVASIAPAGNRTATVHGAAVDTLGYESALAIVNPAALTDGVYTPSLEESLDGSTNWAAAAATDVDGTLVALVASTPQTVGYLGNARYIRISITVTGSPSTGGIFEAGVLLGDPQYAPV